MHRYDFLGGLCVLIFIALSLAVAVAAALGAIAPVR